jgi:GNAT superfamily N-acetyltransferase
MLYLKEARMASFRPINLATDLPAMARLLSLTMPEPLTIEQVREQWQRAEGEIRFANAALNEQEQIVGMVDVVRGTWKGPGYYYFNVIVAPEWRNQGIGTRLFAKGLCFAQAQGARQLESWVRDNAPEALRFAEERGYRFHRHNFESTLDLASFDERPFVDKLERAQAEGFRFFSMADLEPVTEETQRKLYELNRVTGLDNPGNDAVFPPFEEFRKFVFEASWYRADGQILAADGDRWAGMAAVAFYPEANFAYNLFTGVDRPYRGRGLAYALKLMAIRWAQQCGADYIRVNNDSRNAPMLAINRKLGYQPEPGMYYLVRDLE